MIKIRYPKGQPNITEWQTKLEQWVVAHQVVEDDSLTLPILTEGKQIVEGEAAIQVFLKQLEEDINDWRTPRCGV